MPSIIFDGFIAGAFRGRVNVDQDDFGVMLLDESYSPSKTGHVSRADVQEFEIKAKGYTEGGMAAGVSLSLTNDGEASSFDIQLGAAEWRGNIQARWAVYYRNAHGDAVEDDLVAAIDFGGPVTSTNGPFEVGASTLRIDN